MPNAAFALRKAIFARLTGDSTVTSLLGGPKIHDEVPPGRTPPFVVLGEGSVRDASTSLYAGAEHQITLTAWSSEGGVREAFALADAVVTSLEAMGPALDGHRLVNLVALTTEVKRERDARLLRATLRVRAVTERI